MIPFLILSLYFNSISGPIEPHPSTICPDPEIISPCICTKSCPVCPAITKCTEIANIGELERVFEKSKDWTFWNFVITNSSFLYIPSETITVKKVRNLYLRDNVMFALFDKPPPPTNTLQELEVTNLHLQGGVKWDVYSSLIHLKELNITNFEIRKIDQSFIGNFPVGLTGLYLADTKTSQLGEMAFSKLEDLTRIFVRRTQISILQRNMFPKISKLVAMHFSENQIRTLPEDIFTNMPDLQGIDFSFTNIVTLPGRVFENILPQLQLLYFQGNDIDCGCEMKWVPEMQSLPYYLKVTCTRPKSVEGLSIKDLKKNHFLHCA